MIQEYMFMDDTYRTAVEQYVPAKVKVEIYDIDKTSCWIVTYSVLGENEDAAKTLSQVNDYVVANFSPTVLSNESSAYFNKKLFPHINEFERKLRKLLYLRSAIYQGAKKIDNIRNLEAKDLGMIFELLFTDSEFVKNARATMKEKSWPFTKQEMMAALQDIPEDTVWDNLLGKESVKLLRNDFMSVKNYRNDVMHAHNIDAKTYRDAKKLFADINEQLDAEIGRIIQTAEEQPTEIAKSEYNNMLNTAMLSHMSTSLQQVRDAILNVTGAQSNTMQDSFRQLQQLYSSDTITQIQKARKAIEGFYSTTDITNLQETIRQFTAYQRSPEYSELQKQLRENAASFLSNGKDMEPSTPVLKDPTIEGNPDNDADIVHKEENDNA